MEDILIKEFYKFLGRDFRVVTSRDDRSTGTSHSLKVYRTGSERDGHGIGQRFNGTRRNEPAINSRLNEFSVGRNAGGNNRTAQRKRLQENGGKPLGKAGQDQGSSLE